MRRKTGIRTEFTQWARLASIGALTLCAAPQAAWAQFFFRPYGHVLRQPIEDEPRFASRRSIAAIVAHEGFRLVGPLGERGDQIVATGVDGRGRWMRFIIDPYEGEVLGAKFIAALAPTPAEGADRDAPVGRKPMNIGPSAGKPPPDPAAAKPVARAEPPSAPAPARQAPIARQPTSRAQDPARGSSHRAITPPPVATTTTAAPVAPTATTTTAAPAAPPASDLAAPVGGRYNASAGPWRRSRSRREPRRSCRRSPRHRRSWTWLGKRRRASSRRRRLPKRRPRWARTTAAEPTQKKETPLLEAPLVPTCASGRYAAFASTTRGAPSPVDDVDPTRLLRLGQFAHQIDMQQAVLQARAGHDDMVGELEQSLEGARGDALMQEFAAGLLRDLLLGARIESVFSRVSMVISSREKPATASVTR